MDSKKKYEQMVEDGDIVPTYARELYELSKLPPPKPRPLGTMIVPDEANAENYGNNTLKLIVLVYMDGKSLK